MWGDMSDLELRYAHLSDRDTPRRRARREALQEHIAEIQAEQEQRNAACARSTTVTSRFCGSPSGIPLEGLGLCGAYLRMRD